MTKLYKYQKQIVAFLLVLATVLTCLFTSTTAIAYALDTSGDVLDDLQVDSNFNAENYPYDEQDYSLKFIQIAETNTDELLVYVYVPSGDSKNIFANMIRFAVNNENVQDYYLTLLSKNGVFHKYKVDNYRVDLAVGMRNYNIIQLTRKTNTALGDTVVDENNNTIHTVPYTVGRTIGACYVNNNLCYSSFDLELVEITDKYVGQLRYDDGFTMGDTIGLDVDCYSHYIAFNTDREIDTIKNITISYTDNVKSAQRSTLDDSVIYNDISSEHFPEYVITEKDVGEYDSGGILSHKYTWKRIQTVEEFIEDNTFKTLFMEGGITQEGYDNIANKQWVIRFLETPIAFHSTTIEATMFTPSYRVSVMQWHEIDNTTILWLEFETNGVLYSLGCVDNHSKGDGIADNYEKVDILGGIHWILLIVGIILLVILACVILPPVFKIIAIPFKAIRWIFKGKKTQKVEIVNVSQDTYSKKKKKYKYRR